MTTLVYSYGAKHPVEGLDLIHETISKAHRYYNTLIEIRREMREAINAMRARLCPELEAAEAFSASAQEHVEAAISEIKRRNAAERRKRCTEEESRSLAALKEIAALCRAELKEVRASVNGDAEINVALERIYGEYHGTVIQNANALGMPTWPDNPRRQGGKLRKARAECGINFGTYLKVEEAIEKAVNDSAKIGQPPKFKRWTGDGAVTVQVQCGISVKEAMECTDTRLQIGPLQHRGKSERSKCAPVSIVSMRIASDENRKPIWAKVPVYLHRQLPADAKIMWMSLVRKQVAIRRHRHPDKPEGEWRPYYEWSVQFTLRTDKTLSERSGIPSATTGACGIDLGWRLNADGSLRVAYVVGDDGRNESFDLPASLLGKLRHSEDIRSIRDMHFNQVVADVSRFRANCKPSQWFMEMTEHILQWKGHGRMASLLARWERERFAGDELIIEIVRQWMVKDAHLWQYERSNTIKALVQRKHLYRTFASQMRERYRTISVEDCDWRTLAKLPAADDNSKINTLARWHQRTASVGLLRELLIHAGAVPVKSEDTTRECCRCHLVNEWEDKTELCHTCAGCGVTMDQDENAARNLLARALAESPRAGGAEPATKPGPDSPIAEGAESATASTNGRWARRKAERLRKLTEAGANPLS